MRENHEFKAAKEMQKVLMARKGELEIDLTRARGTDFSDASIDKVSVGNKLGVTNLDSGKDEVFILLGAWDGDPEKQILSYLTPLGQAFLGKKPSEDAEFDNKLFSHNKIGILISPGVWSQLGKPILQVVNHESPSAL